MERERYIMKHKNRIVFIIIITIIIASLICIPNIKNMINVTKQEKEYIKLVEKNKILLNEINDITKEINKLEENSKFIENAETYKKELETELTTKKEEIAELEKDIKSINKKIITQKSKNEEIKQYVIE